MAGRLHKPVRFLKQIKSRFDDDDDNNNNFELSLNNNLINAINTSLFLNTFNDKKYSSNNKNENYISLEKLYHDIIGISYLGDFRTLIKAEKSNKKELIFQGNKNRFLQLYQKRIFSQISKHVIFLSLNFFENKYIIKQSIGFTDVKY